MLYRDFEFQAYLTAMCVQTPWVQDDDLPNDPLAVAVLVRGMDDMVPRRYSDLQRQIQLEQADPFTGIHGFETSDGALSQWLAGQLCKPSI